MSRFASRNDWHATEHRLRTLRLQVEAQQREIDELKGILKTCIKVDPRAPKVSLHPDWNMGMGPNYGMGEGNIPPGGSE